MTGDTATVLARLAVAELAHVLDHLLGQADGEDVDALVRAAGTAAVVWGGLRERIGR